MKVAAIQMPTVKDKIQNIRTAGTYIEKIKAENPDSSPNRKPKADR